MGLKAERRSGEFRRRLAFRSEMMAFLQSVPGVAAVSTAGSLRRMRATVGDLDLLVAAVSSKPVIEAFVNHPDVLAVSGQGEVKASVEFTQGIRAQLWVHPPERWGTALHMPQAERSQRPPARTRSCARIIAF
jgi:DNA polymerase (family 10)